MGNVMQYTRKVMCNTLPKYFSVFPRPPQGQLTSLRPSSL